MKRNIYGVYFVCCRGNYKKIVEEQLDIVKKSGLLDKTTELLCFICEFDVGIMKLFQPLQTKIKFITTKENLYEKFALQNFRHYIKKSHHPYYLYYFHTKGVSHRIDETYYHNIRHNLDYFILEKHDLCIKWLDRGFDAVGTTLSLYPSLHFSGNFWWSTSTHLDRLPHSIRSTYYAPEMYICSYPNGRYISICQHTNFHSHIELKKLSDKNIMNQSTTVPLENTSDKDMSF